MFILRIIKFFLFIIITSACFGVGAFSGEIQKKDMTIGEIKTNIKKLKEKKEEVNNSWENFLKNNWEIKDFLKINLKKEDIEKILFLAKKVWESNDRWRKVEFYKKLFPFVTKEQKDNFFAYIKWETAKLDKQKIIKKEIIVQKKVLNKKVEKYSKIKKNYEKKTNLALKNVIRKTTIKMLEVIENKQSYKKLKTERRIFLYNTFIEKLKQKKENFLKIFNKQDSKQQRKLIILNVIIEELEKKIENMKK